MNLKPKHQQQQQLMAVKVNTVVYMEAGVADVDKQRQHYHGGGAALTTALANVLALHMCVSV